jgi:hypothetical protein
MSLNFILFIILILFAGCGKKNDNSNEQKAYSPVLEKSETLRPSGQYLGILKNLQPQFNPYLRGAGTISIDRDELITDVSLSGGEKKILYAQQIRKGIRCPDKREDTNQDGFIDIVEAQNVVGDILFPLDGDISSQLAFDSIFPISDDYGNYVYSKVTNVDLFLRDLYSPTLAHVPYSKLHPQETFNPEGLILLIQGISREHELPYSVGTLKRMSSHQSLPIACAVFKKVLEVPGELEL